MRVCYDSVTAPNCPAGAPLYLGYVNGAYANAEQMRALHPAARIVTVTVTAAEQADMLDVEPGDASPGDVVQWLGVGREAGAWPSIYCGLTNWTPCRAACWKAGIAEPPWFVAHYTGVPHIEPGAVATQWADLGPYDVSAVADFWAGVDLTSLLLEDAPVTLAATLDGDTCSYLVRVWFNRECGVEPTVTQLDQFAAAIPAQGLDPVLATIRDSQQAANFRAKRGW